MKYTFHILFTFALVSQASLFAEVPEDNREYPTLWQTIEQTHFVDVHSHPSVGHVDYPDRDVYPTLEPPLFRPFWIIDESRIAVFETMQVDGLRRIYGYRGETVIEDDLAELTRLSKDFWAGSKKEAFDRLLDRCGIDVVFANSSQPAGELDQKRVKWVPFADSFFYPLDPSSLTTIRPDLPKALESYHQEVIQSADYYSIEIDDFDSYLTLIDARMRDYKEKGAVAVKVGSAYLRSLWFDQVETEEAREIFNQSRLSPVTQWVVYKRLQDYLARYSFKKAGELEIPVHIHTGFGANATLRNQDSDPWNLESVFSDMSFSETQFVMLHGAYPSCNKLKPLLEKRNVFVEFSAINWMTYADELASILVDWLTYPGLTRKVMFGADAGAPVFFWIAAENSRRALYIALSQLISQGIISEERAALVAKTVMRDNALRVHRLDNGNKTR